MLQLSVLAASASGPVSLADAQQACHEDDCPSSDALPQRVAKRLATRLTDVDSFSGQGPRY